MVWRAWQPMHLMHACNNLRQPILYACRLRSTALSSLEIQSLLSLHSGLEDEPVEEDEQGVTNSSNSNSSSSKSAGSLRSSGSDSSGSHGAVSHPFSDIPVLLHEQAAAAAWRSAEARHNTAGSLESRSSVDSMPAHGVDNTASTNNVPMLRRRGRPSKSSVVSPKGSAPNTHGVSLDMQTVEKSVISQDRLEGILGGYKHACRLHCILVVTRASKQPLENPRADHQSKASQIPLTVILHH